MSISVQYFLLSFLLMSLIGIVIAAWIFSKWNVVGPRWKNRWRKRIHKWKSRLNRKIPRISGSKVKFDKKYYASLKDNISNAEDNYSLLEAQNIKKDLDNEIKKLELQIAKKIEKKNEKKERKLARQSTKKGLNTLKSKLETDSESETLKLEEDIREGGKFIQSKSKKNKTTIDESNLNEDNKSLVSNLTLENPIVKDQEEAQPKDINDFSTIAEPVISKTEKTDNKSNKNKKSNFTIKKGGEK